jgi:uncharacterized lipoprotein YddW (UPF0748 family)
MNAPSSSMNPTRRRFIRSAAGVAFASRFGLTALHAEDQITAGAAGNLPHNWVWMRPDPNRTDEQWKKLFEKLKGVGIDAVLPEIYNGNTALFDHPNPLVKTHAQVLERLIPLAHDAGVQVHAWMWTVPCNNRRIIEQHGDWYAVNGKGEPAHQKPAYVNYYRFLCPRRPEVREFVAGTVQALSAIDDLDGVHLDYVRLPDVILAKGLWAKYGIVQDREYPEYDYCYCDHCRSVFKEESGIDPLTDLEDPSASDAWRKFRYDSVSELVRDNLAPRARQRGKAITAAVFPNWDYVRQAWHTWGLDAYLPMLYHSFYQQDLAWIGQQTQAAIERCGSSTPIFPGLFIPALDPTQLGTAIQSGRRGGGRGVAIFSEGGLSDEHWQVLGQSLK